MKERSWGSVELKMDCMNIHNTYININLLLIYLFNHQFIIYSLILLHLLDNTVRNWSIVAFKTNTMRLLGFGFSLYLLEICSKMLPSC